MLPVRKLLSNVWWLLAQDTPARWLFVWWLVALVPSGQGQECSGSITLHVGRNQIQYTNIQAQRRVNLRANRVTLLGTCCYRLSRHRSSDKRPWQKLTSPGIYRVNISKVGSIHRISCPVDIQRAGQEPWPWVAMAMGVVLVLVCVLTINTYRRRSFSRLNIEEDVRDTAIIEIDLPKNHVLDGLDLG